jgi:hypothetical protein
MTNAKIKKSNQGLMTNEEKKTRSLTVASDKGACCNPDFETSVLTSGIGHSFGIWGPVASGAAEGG